MNRLQRILEKTRDDLDDLRTRWCLVGGLAVAVWAEPRLTRDIDVIVAVESDRQAEALIRALQRSGYRMEEVIEQEAAGRLATARFSLEKEPNGIVVDVLFASSGLEIEAAEAAVLVEVFEGVRVPVAPRAHLIVMKLLARDDRERPMDADDLKSLIMGASVGDLDEAHTLSGLVEKRGYARGRKLRELLEQAISGEAGS